MTSEAEKLVVDNLKIAYYTANKYYLKYNVEFDDAVSISYIGLIKAAEHFDASRKVKFSTYAIKCILTEFRKELRKQSRRVDTISLNTLISDNSDLTFADLFPDEDNHYLNIEYDEILQNCLSKLTDREKEIVIDYLHNSGLKQVDLAEKFGISRQRVSIIINKFRDNYRTELNQNR